MNYPDLFSPGAAGLVLIVVFVSLMLVYGWSSRRTGQPPRISRLRGIPAFARLGRGVGLAVEAGQRLHLSLGSGGVQGLRGVSALVGLSMLQRIARAASISDRPPVATSGEATLAILTQDSLRSAYHAVGADTQFDPLSGQITGLTPFSYAVGTLPILYDQHVSATVLAGHFGAEVALMTDASERNGSLTLAGSDNLPAQAVLFATAQEPLIGEELYAGGAYLQAGLMHFASLRAQDIFRWVLIAAILGGVALKLVGAI